VLSAQLTGPPTVWLLSLAVVETAVRLQAEPQGRLSALPQCSISLSSPALPMVTQPSCNFPEDLVLRSHFLVDPTNHTQAMPHCSSAQSSSSVGSKAAARVWTHTWDAHMHDGSRAWPPELWRG
jgi:hypothetical protein